SSPEGRSFNYCMPMPLKSGMKLTVTNETDTNLGLLFYDANYTVGDHHPAGTLYLHAHWRRENPTTMRRDFEVLPKLRGRGRFVGVNFGVRANKETYFHSWWGEGEVKAYIDGDTA